MFGQEWGGHEPVERSPDLTRILALPRRVWTEDAARALAVELSDRLRAPGGTMQLRPLQAIALLEMAQAGGLLGPIGVGEGKTLLSLLAFTVLGSKYRILLMPASLKEKTEDEQRQLMRHWQISMAIHMISYESLGRESFATELERLTRNAKNEEIAIVADEAHKLKNAKAGVTRRVLRFLDARPGVRFVAISGTIVRGSLSDVAPLSARALGAGSPYPRETHTIEEWGDCVDEGINPMRRRPPGALSALAEGEGTGLEAVRRGLARRMRETRGVVASGDERLPNSLEISAWTYEVPEVSRLHFKRLRNLSETPEGFAFADALEARRLARALVLGLHYVRVDPEMWTCLAPITRLVRRITQSTARRISSDLEPMIELAQKVATVKDRETLCSKVDTVLRRANTIECMSSKEAYALFAEKLASGKEDLGAFASIIAMGPERFEAYYASHVTEQLEYSAIPWTESKELLRICLALSKPNDNWLQIRRDWASWCRKVIEASEYIDTELQVKRAVDAGLINDMGRLARWREQEKVFSPLPIPAWHTDEQLEMCAKWLEKEKGIVWTEHRYFAMRLSEMTGAPYFGQDAKTKAGLHIKDAKKGPIIASIRSCGTGQNLQDRWHKNLLTAPMSGGDIMEQLLGRTHRHGQPADTVTMEVLWGCAEHAQAAWRARRSAGMIRDVMGTSQRLCYADIDYPDEDELPSAGPQWDRQAKSEYED